MSFDTAEYATPIGEMIPLSDIANVVGGYAFKGSDFGDCGVPIVKIANIEPPRVNIQSCEKIAQEKLSGLDRFRLAKGDILMAMTGATVGKVGRIRDHQTAYLNQRVAKIFSKIGPEYDDFIFALLSQKGFEEKILNNSSGSAQANVSADGIGRVLVPALPPNNQLKVGKFIAALDDKIDLNRRINQTLEAMAQAIFKSWFVDFDPVKAKIAAIVEGRDPLHAAMSAISGKSDTEFDALPPEQYKQLAATAALFPDEMEESELGEIPRGWSAKPLDTVANYLNGLALQKFPPKGDSDFLPVIKIAQLRAGHVDGADRAASDLKAEFIVCDGDVLFSWSGSLEVDVWTGGRGALNQHLFKVTSSTVPKWFYLWATKYHLPEFREIAANKATTMGHIQRKHLSDARIATPTTEFFTQSSKVLSPVLDEIVSLRLQSRDLAKARDTLLPKLLSGELSVTEATAEAEA